MNIIRFIEDYWHKVNDYVNLTYQRLHSPCHNMLSVSGVVDVNIYSSLFAMLSCLFSIAGNNASHEVTLCRVASDLFWQIIHRSNSVGRRTFDFLRQTVSSMLYYGSQAYGERNKYVDLQRFENKNNFDNLNLILIQ